MRNVRDTALGLHALGIRKGDSVGILSGNCPEWTFADLGILSLGAVTVPIYPTASPDDTRHIISHAHLKAIFISTGSVFLTVRPFLAGLSAGRIILFCPGTTAGVLSLRDLMAKGRDVELNQGRVYESCVESVGPDDLATIIYTSGTTGPPKGVMLTHRNFISNYQGGYHRIQILETDSVLSFLPLSHVFERLVGYYFMAANGAVIWYAENMTTVADDILKVRPTVMIAVPRFFEKTYARILEEVRKAPAWRQAVFHWALRVGTRVSHQKIRGRKVPARLAVLLAAARVLVLNRLKNALGGRLRFFISGGAPLSRDLARFFHAADVLILEGYGLTETSPVISVNAVGDCRFGTVGKPIGNVQIRIAEDGEILTAGPCVMRGYFEDPGATAAIVRDGWLYTGDIGYMDEEGFLHITDRKKDIIVTAGGKNIAPQNIERALLADGLFSQVVVIGDKRPYLCALIVLSREALEDEAKKIGLRDLPYEDLMKSLEIRDRVRMRMERCQAGLAPYERIKAFEILPGEFTVGAGELTATLKVRRQAVIAKYQLLIDDLYRRTDAEWTQKAK